MIENHGVFGVFRRHMQTVLLGCVVCAQLLGCSGADTIGAPATLTTIPYLSLRLNVRAAVMSTVAPYDTIQLIATAYDAAGNSIPTPDSEVTYVANDTTLSVSPTGLLTAKHVTNSDTYVVARWQSRDLNITHEDTAYIVVTANPPDAPIATFSIQPVAGDSSIEDVDIDCNYDCGRKSIQVAATDALGQSIEASLPVHFQSSNASTATIQGRTGLLTAIAAGVTEISAATRYYGTTVADSLRFTVGMSDFNFVTTQYTIQPSGTVTYQFQPSQLTIGVNKSVAFITGYAEFENYGVRRGQLNFYPNTAQLSVVFDDSNTVLAVPQPTLMFLDAGWSFGNEGYAGNLSTGTGNISIMIPPDILPPTTLSSDRLDFPALDTYCNTAPYPCATTRLFPKAGTYHYHSVLTGATGTITVVGP